MEFSKVSIHRRLISTWKGEAFWDRREAMTSSMAMEQGISLEGIVVHLAFISDLMYRMAYCLSKETGLSSSLILVSCANQLFCWDIKTYSG